jgi:hypothetical protein
LRRAGWNTGCVRHRVAGPKKALVGSWNKPRYAPQERQMGIGEAWATGAIAAAVLVMFGAGAFANVMNQFIGVSYVAKYDVANTYIGKGKPTCCSLAILNVRNLPERFEFCATKSEYEGTAVRDQLQVSGRRSKYVNEVRGNSRAQ